MITSLTDNFLKRLHPIELAKEAGITLDPWQEEMVSSTSNRLLLNCSRQIGKSTTTAVLVIYTALYEPNSLILLLSPSERQSQELFRKCLEIYQATGRPVDPDAENKLGLELENGSRIYALPGKEGTIRGFSGVRLLIIDEASRVPDALYASVRPMLAVSGGRLIVLSTPFGKRGWFYEACKKQKQKHQETWDYYEIPASECPRITAAFLAQEEEDYGWYWIQQEYHCQFHDTLESAFRAEDIESLIKPEWKGFNLF
jgi:Terminase large subunit, T4likevirus-type, N-terminal